MISESKTCPDCDTIISPIDSNLQSNQTDSNGVEFQINTITIQCRNGHRNLLAINHREESN